MDKIIARLADENTDLKGVIDIAHFNVEKKLGSGKEMVDKLTDLISIFQRPELDFSRNKAEGDDIIGDAYEYLMRKFATESGKSKGQFYTPAEVSRILANVVGISRCTNTSATVCDPACGSGSLLIRAIDAAPIPIMGYGQEKESTTAGLAKMNAVLHRKAEITIKSGNTYGMKGSECKFVKYMEGSDKRFVIPVYQRNYDWKTENCKQLYDDLVKIIKEHRKSHFFGSLVSVYNPDGHNEEFLIIDGQQRLTTVSLLFLAMYNLIDKSLTPASGLAG